MDTYPAITPVKVIVYTKPGSAECARVMSMLVDIAPQLGIEVQESPSPEGAPAPCVRFVTPGAPFYNAENMSEQQFIEYVDAARAALQPDDTPIREKASTSKTKNKPKAGSLPTASYEAGHPIRSFLWRHRVGAIIGALTGFVGLAWGAAITPSLGWGTGFYNAVHSTYRLFCDQVPERSAAIGGLPVCLCWRCTAIYIGALLFGIVYTIGRDHKVALLKWLVRPVSLWIMLLYGLPLILDGASHALGWRSGISYANSDDFWLSWQAFSFDWWLRIGTALLATVGAVKFLCPRLDKLGDAYERLYNIRKHRSPRALDTAPRPISN